MRLLYVLAAFLAISQSCGNEEDDCHKIITFLNQTNRNIVICDIFYRVPRYFKLHDPAKSYIKSEFHESSAPRN